METINRVERLSSISFETEAETEVYKSLLNLQNAKSKLNIALSGGATPLPIYKRLAKRPLDWGQFCWYLVDERCVPYDDEQSNFNNIKNNFFNYIDSKYYPMYQENEGVSKSIEKYNELIYNKLDVSIEGVPQFDLIILGMGEDGHTASLFPNTTILNERESIVSSVYVPKLNSNRISITYPIILNAKERIVLINSKSKASLFQTIMDGKRLGLPIEKIYDQSNSTWIIGE